VALRQADDRLPSWQAMDSGRLLLLAVTGMLVVAALAHTAAERLTDPQVAIAFGSVIAIGELLRLGLPGGREAAPIASAAALAYALLLRVGQLPPGHIHRVVALQVIAVTAVGMTVGVLPHIAAGRPAGLTGMATRLVAVACVAFAFRPIAGSELISSSSHWWVAFAVMTLLIAVGWLVEATINALIRADDLRARFSVTFWDELRVELRLGAAVGVSAMMIAFAAEVMGLAELAVLMGPLLVTQVAFRKYSGIRATYLQTVRALARVTEVGGYVESGHSRRVSRLAVAVGRELGLAEPDLLDLEYAALMHDIGQLALPDPIPGGATVLVSREDQQRIAELGAEVITKAGVLDRVAELVRCQSLPSRGHDPEPPVGSRIIRAANAFDDLVGGSLERDRSTAALERLRLDTAAEYDPGVVEALAAVASRRLVSRLE
jgi:acid phosphatase family membrane protein YuiD